MLSVLFGSIPGESMNISCPYTQGQWALLVSNDSYVLCRFYHIPNNFCRLLLLITNQVIVRAQSLVNRDIFLYPDEVKIHFR